MENMTFSQYEEDTKKTLAKYIRDKNQDERYTELILGLFEEGGEVTSIIRRSIKGNFHEVNIDFEHLKEEIGDVLWYITHIAYQLPNTKLEEVARRNLEKTHMIYQKDASNSNESLGFNQYVEAVTNTYREDLPKTQEERARFFSLGLIKEIGKISELFGEHRIDATRLDIYKVKEKLGDGLWYLAAICENYGLDLGKIAKANSEKTQGRYNEEGIVINRPEEDEPEQ